MFTITAKIRVCQRNSRDQLKNKLNPKINTRAADSVIRKIVSLYQQVLAQEKTLSHHNSEEVSYLGPMASGPYTARARILMLAISRD